MVVDGLERGTSVRCIVTKGSNVRREMNLIGDDVRFNGG